MKNKKLIFLIFYFISSRLYPQQIHVFGDSHSNSFATISNTKIHHIGAITMHRVGRDGIGFLNIKNYGVQENDIVIFSFGEIDARCHIGKQRDEFKRDLNEIITTLVEKYLKTIADNKKNYKNLTCIIFCPIPPNDRAFNPDFPSYGTVHDRIFITKTLSKKIKEKAHNFLILDVYDLFSNSEGVLNPEFEDIHKVHIDPNKNFLLKETLFNLLENQSKFREAVLKNDFNTIKKLLLDNDININLQDENGTTPLMLATYFNYHEIVKILLNKGADITIKNNLGFDALHYARQNNNNQIVEALR